jgi:hypothetical protein
VPDHEEVLRFSEVLEGMEGVVAVLPLASLASRSLKEYAATASSYAAYAAAQGLPKIPLTYESVMGWLTALFLRGRKPATFAALCSRLKWIAVHVWGTPWLDEDLVALRAGRRALSKLSPHRVRKAKPLYQFTLKRIAAGVDPSALKDNIFLALWAVATACLSRLGEMLKARRANVKLIDAGSKGKFFIIGYFAWNRPKQHKIRNAPYALVSEANNPLAFDMLRWLLVRAVADAPSSPLFPQVNTSGEVVQAGVAARHAVTWLQNRLRQANFPDAKLYGQTSARRGGLSSALDREVPLHFCEVQGHWALSGGTALVEYRAHSWWTRLKYF